MDDIEIKDLKYVEAIARHENLTKAANELCITQPSLSGYLKNLERRMGKAIFERLGKRMVLTYFGRCFLNEGQEILLKHNYFKKQMEKLVRDESGSLSIGLPILRGISFLPITLPLFHRLCPNIEVHCYEEDASILDAMIQDGDLDIGFFNSPVAAENINYQVISNEEIVLTTSKDDPIVVKAKNRAGFSYPWLDLKLCRDHDFIMNYPGQRTYQIATQLFNQAGFVPHVSLKIRSLITTVELSALGYGMAFASAKYPTEMCIGEKPSIFSVGETPIYMNFIAGYRKDKKLSSYAQTFIDIAKENY